MDKNDELLLLKEIISRDVATTEFNPPVLEQQKAFVEDPAKFKSLLCSRRSGKSTIACIYLLKQALSIPNSQHLYIGLTRKSAKTFVWRELKAFNSKYKLGITFNNTDLVCETPLGSQIFLVGGNDEEAIEAVRGTIKPRLITIDEAASYRSHLRYLIDEVLTPMLIDYNGTLCLLGTPSAACTGPFFDATTGVDKVYSNHRWTIQDNLFIPHAIDWLKAYKIAKAWADDNPIYLREWCGRWIKTLDSLVYKYDSDKNDISALPMPGKYSYLLGVDIGYNDATAFTVGAYRENDPTFYVVETFAKTGMIVDTIMSKIAEFVDKYNPEKIVMDSGGGGKLVAESFRKRYSIPVSPAQKTEKRDFIEQMNSDFHSGRIKILDGNQELKEEWSLIQWDDDHKKEDERFLNDRADSCLYTWRESTHYTETIPDKEPPINSDSWYQKEIRRMEEEAELRYQEQHADGDGYPED